MIGVEVASIVSWEVGRSEPKVSYLPAILGWLGYDPTPPEGKTFGEKLRNKRRCCGLTQGKLARKLGICTNVVNKLERGYETKDKRVLAAVRGFLGGGGER